MCSDRLNNIEINKQTQTHDTFVILMRLIIIINEINLKFKIACQTYENMIKILTKCTIEKYRHIWKKAGQYSG